MSHRIARLRELEMAIGDRTLVWFGIRGEDAAGLLALPQFRDSFSITAPLHAAKLDVAESLEELTDRRVDLDVYDIDLDESNPAVNVFRRRLLARANQHSVISTYRPSHVLSDITFASQGTSSYLGLFKDFQHAFEYKPWVETELKRRGVRTMPWAYIADEFRHLALRLLEDGSIVLRPSRGSGGVGLALVKTPEELESRWVYDPGRFGAVSRYFADAIPVNVGGCVFDKNDIRLHPGSVQLIGLRSCTTRVFGYCGNDFGRFRTLGQASIAEVDRLCRVVGGWLGEKGYRGAFGVDLLVDGEDVWFAEVNARFQGSTAMSVALVASVAGSDIVLDHLAAFLGLPPGPDQKLSDWVKELGDAAQVVVHNAEDYPVRLSTPGGASGPPGTTPVRVELLPPARVAVDPGAVLSRLVYQDQVTTNGRDLTTAAEACVQWTLQRFVK